MISRPNAGLEGTRPRVSIGLPVYNGERYLASALDSLLAQTYGDFELIISDNASTDRTGALCAAYQAADPRVRYSRLERNIGGFRNHNRVVHLARGEYFTWAAHDDLRRPAHLERLVTALEAHPEAVLSYCAVTEIDEDGVALPDLARDVPAGGTTASERWTDIVTGRFVYEPLYGLIRMQALRATNLMGQFPDSDRVLLGELALRGRFLKLQEALFLRRVREDRRCNSLAQYETLDAYVDWYAPGGASPPAPRLLNTLRGHLTALSQAPVPLRERWHCVRTLLRWATLHQYELRFESGLTLSQWRGRSAGRRGLRKGMEASI